MSVITENDCFVEKNVIDNNKYGTENAGIIDLINKTMLILQGNNILAYNKIISILTHQFTIDMNIRKIYFRISPRYNFTIIYGWLIKDRTAYSFSFSYKLGEYIDLNLDHKISWYLIPNHGYPSNNRINKSIFTYSPVAFLCLNSIGLYSIKYLKP